MPSDHSDPYNYSHIPEATREGLDAWASSGRPTGGFLRAVLENDLRGALSRADHENARAIAAIVSYCHNELPGGCWGSPERYRTWPEEREKLQALTARLNRKEKPCP